LSKNVSGLAGRAKVIQRGSPQRKGSSGGTVTGQNAEGGGSTMGGRTGFLGINGICLQNSSLVSGKMRRMETICATVTVVSPNTEEKGQPTSDSKKTQNTQKKRPKSPLCSGELSFLATCSSRHFMNEHGM